MSIFDVVDLNVTQRKTKAFALSEPPPPVFNQKLVSDVPGLLDATPCTDGRPPAGENTSGQRVRMVIYLCWACWVLCATVPHLHGIAAADAALEKFDTRPHVPFDCNLSFLSLFVTFPCLCVDVFCKWILHGRYMGLPLLVHTLCILMLVISVQHRCLANKITSPATVVFVFSVALGGACATQTLILRDKDADSLVARARLWGFVCTGGLVATSCITAIAGIYTAQRETQDGFFAMHQWLLVGAICLYAATTVCTLHPLFLVCSHLQNAC